MRLIKELVLFVFHFDPALSLSLLIFDIDEDTPRPTERLFNYFFTSD